MRDDIAVIPLNTGKRVRVSLVGRDRRKLDLRLHVGDPIDGIGTRTKSGLAVPFDALPALRDAIEAAMLAG